MGSTVLHLCSLTRRNGTVHMASQLCRLLAGAGHSVIVGAKRDAKIFEWTEGSGVECVDEFELASGFSPRSLSRDVARVRELIATRGVDIVHAWQSHETYIAALSVLGTRAALVRTRAVTKPIRAHLGRPLMRRVVRATFVTCSRIERAVRESGFPAERIHTLVEGVDLQRFKPDASARSLRDELAIAQDAIVVVNVGRLEKVKGQVHFVDALARLPENVVGVIAGEGKARAAIEKRAAALGVAPRLRLLGKRGDVPRVLAMSDVYALTSVGSEGSSRATLEALATGLPVVCSDVGMLPDIVGNGRNGTLVPPGDAEALAVALRALVDDRGLRVAIGARARDFAESERSEQHMLASVERVYDAVTRKRVAR